MMQLHQISKRYQMGSRILCVLSECNLDIHSGEWVSIVGPSGSGKSTLMCILGCLDQPDSGQYFLESQEISDLGDVELAGIRNRKIGFIFQNFHLVSHYTALQNVMLPLVYSACPRELREKKAQQVLHEVGLANRMTHLPMALSGGERQRVAIARALVNDPDVVLADEPTGNLDSITGQAIMEILKRLHHAGKTMVIVTHDPWVASHAQRQIRMSDGKICHA